MTPLSLRAALGATLLALLTACGSPGASNNANETYIAPPGVVVIPPAANDGQGQASPAAGQTRAGQIYNVSIPSPLDGETIAATVFEPSTITGGEKYPLVLYASGFGDTRETSYVSTAPQAVAFKTLVDLQQLNNAGFGVLSFDHRGHGETNGKIRVMDPDYEGANVLRTVDWAEANLDWLAYGMSQDGSDPNNLMLGSVGASYGGGYQLMLNAIDPKKRLDAIVPLLTWNNLPYSLAGNNVIKDAWVNTLAGGKDDLFDPFFLEQLNKLFVENQTNPDIVDTLHYHSTAYWCNESTISNNGGFAPLRASAKPPKVNALFAQSSRDILFNLNDAWANYSCYNTLGGDVRLYSVQIGHNTIGTLSYTGQTTAPPDPGAPYQVGDPFSLSSTCAGETMMNSTLAFFDEHLNGNTGASTVSNPLCLDLSANYSILADDLTVGGTQYTIDGGLLNSNLITVGQDDSATTTTVSLFSVSDAQGEVIAGIPTLNVTLTDEDNPSNADGINTIVFAAIGHKRAAGLGAQQWDIIDNQLTPLRGLGNHQINMVGVLEKLNVGDEIGLMLFGEHALQYETTGSRSENPHAARVRVTGTVNIPQLGPIAAQVRQ